MSKKKEISTARKALLILSCVSIGWLIAWMYIAGFRHLYGFDSFIGYALGAIIASFSFCYYRAPKTKYIYKFAIFGSVLIFALSYLIGVFVAFGLSSFNW